ncbi:hypothetical protein D3C72_2423730 [compost metagenome]
MATRRTVNAVKAPTIPSNSRKAQEAKAALGERGLVCRDGGRYALNKYQVAYIPFAHS